MATQLKIVNPGAEGGSLEVSEKAFGREFNEALVHQVVTAYMAAGRAGTDAVAIAADPSSIVAKASAVGRSAMSLARPCAIASCSRRRAS